MNNVYNIHLIIRFTQKTYINVPKNVYYKYNKINVYLLKSIYNYTISVKSPRNISIIKCVINIRTILTEIRIKVKLILTYNTSAVFIFI